MISAESVRLVRRKVATGGGTVTAISVMRTSEMTPAPLGISETRPSADAPRRTARHASSIELMQQIFTRVIVYPLLPNINIRWKTFQLLKYYIKEVETIYSEHLDLNIFPNFSCDVNF
jgi:hypothetical protein